jgi:formyl-CoA transferase
VSFWVEGLSQIGVPVAAINTLEQMLDHPQTKARGIVMDYELSAGKPIKGIASPLIIDDEPRTAGRPPPALGEHTMEVLLEFGWSADRIAELAMSKSIGIATANADSPAQMAGSLKYD